MERNRSVKKAGPGRTPGGAAIMRVGVTEALTRSFFQEWARVGYSGVSLERVAGSAGVGKAALYRRWPEKAAMASVSTSDAARHAERLQPRLRLIWVTACWIGKA